MFHFFRRSSPASGPNLPDDAAIREQFGEVDPEICRRVLTLLCEQLGVDCEVLLPETRFIEDLRADELEPVEIAMAIEEEFGLYLPDVEAEKIGTVGDLVAWVDRRMSL